jgi:hypothetical protein
LPPDHQVWYTASQRERATYLDTALSSIGVYSTKLCIWFIPIRARVEGVPISQSSGCSDRETIVLDISPHPARAHRLVEMKRELNSWPMGCVTHVAAGDSCKVSYIPIVQSRYSETSGINRLRERCRQIPYHRHRLQGKSQTYSNKVDHSIMLFLRRRICICVKLRWRDIVDALDLRR